MRIRFQADADLNQKHFGEFIAKAASAGVIVVPQSLPVGRVLDELALIWAASQPEEWVNRIAYLPL